MRVNNIVEEGGLLSCRGGGHLPPTPSQGGGGVQGREDCGLAVKCFGVKTSFSPHFPNKTTSVADSYHHIINLIPLYSIF